ncbi:hypothetical protein ACLVWQ_05900 [Streptomyces sp. CWNU-52B]|uniref:hypothetical protein n=1 Tax=unclassified Streptomyces TaxID=2593676 RepID=UPI0039BFE56A
MVDPSGLRPEDRADFEAVLHLALNTPDVRDALRADPTGRTARLLRIRALAAADEITAATYDEYRAYLTRVALREAAEQAAPATQRRSPGAGPLAALAVLTPSVAASAAAALLVLGYVLRLADVRGSLPGSLISVGWVLALVGAVSTLVVLAALLATAIRGHGGSAAPARLEQARLDWQLALLEHGMLPHLRRSIGEDERLRPAPPRSASPSTDTRGPHSRADTGAVADGFEDAPG